MKIGEVCLLTSDVIRLSDFYKMLFIIDNGCNDDVHQFIISEETTFIVPKDGLYVFPVKGGGNVKNIIGEISYPAY